MHWLDSLLGVPSAAALAALARPYAALYATGEAFICGPDPYLTLVREALGQLRVPGVRVHVERFLSLAENPFEETQAAPDDGLAATLSVTLDDAITQLPWPAGTRMLDALLDEGLDAPFSCRQGICGACACQLTSGEVRMAHNEVLEEADVAEGYILACQAVSLTPVGLHYLLIQVVKCRAGRPAPPAADASVTQGGKTMPLTIGDTAPDFEAETSEEADPLLRPARGLLGSPCSRTPKDFTPICTTELGYMAKIKPTSSTCAT